MSTEKTCASSPAAALPSSIISSADRISRSPRGSESLCEYLVRLVTERDQVVCCRLDHRGRSADVDHASIGRWSEHFHEHVPVDAATVALPRGWLRARER